MKDEQLCIVVNNSIYISIKIIYLNIFNILASDKGYLEIVEFLCQHKAEVNLQDNEGRTALHCGILFNLNLNLNY
jgi:ankyrin repeat protein